MRSRLRRASARRGRVTPGTPLLNRRLSPYGWRSYGEYLRFFSGSRDAARSGVPRCPPPGDALSASTAAPAVATRRPGLVLATIVLVQLLFGIDSSVANVALPTIGAELGLDLVARSWVQTAYVLGFGGLLLLGGRLGAMLGRRRMLVVGVL